MRSSSLRFAPLLLLALVPACKSSDDDASLPDAGVAPFDAALDLASDVPQLDALPEAAPDAAVDVAEEPDAGDAAPDVAEEPDALDATPDAVEEPDAEDAAADAVEEPDAVAQDAAPDAPDDADASPFTVLASGQTNPRQLVVGGGWVYWLNQLGSYVGSVPSSGGAEVDITPGSQPKFIWADATNLYWHELGGDFYKRPHGGGSPVKLGSMAAANVNQMTSDGTYLYWTDSGDHYPRRLPIDGSSDGGTPEPLGSSITSPGGVTVAGGTVFVTEGWGSGGVDEVTGATTSVLVQGSSLYNTNPARILNDGTYLFWIESPFGSSSIEGCKLDGSALTRYVGSASLASIAVDGTSLYYSNGSNLTIVRYAAGDRFSGQTLYNHLGYDAYALAVDATSLYWPDDTNGVIYKAPK